MGKDKNDSSDSPENEDLPRSEKEQAPKKKKGKKGERLPRRRSLSKIKALPSEDKSLAESNDPKAMLRRIAEMFEDLEDRLEYIHEQVHVLPEELQKFLTQPEEYVKNHDKVVEQYEEKLAEKLVKVLGKRDFVAQRKKRMKKRLKKRGRKAQKLRGRKKWIPMD